LYFFFREAVSFKLDHHFRKIFRDDSPGYSDLFLENGGPVKSLFDVEGIIFRAVVNKRKSFALFELGRRMSQAKDRFDVEVFMDQRSGNVLFKPRDKDPTSEFLLLLFLLIQEGRINYAAWMPFHYKGGSAEGG
jgi:hypothetical protein